MNWTELKTDQYVSLKKTLFSGQIFSFIKTADEEYTGFIENNLFTLKQEEGKVFYLTHNDKIKDDTAKINSVLYNFFTLDLNYNEIFKHVEEKNQNLRLLKNIISSSTGLRLLRLDPLETIFSFICSSNNNIKRITKMVNFLFSRGDFVKRINNHDFYTFPKPSKLVDLENEFIKYKFGYRSKYICDTAKSIQHVADFKGFIKDTYEDNLKFLLKLKGIGKKVADCICLMGFNKHHVVPIDTHIFKKSKVLFKHDISTLNNKNYKILQKVFIENFGEYSGLVQLFVFKYSLDN